MNYRIIATGSTGNAVTVNDNILIDCGVSYKQIENVAHQIKLVLLTHEHGDHFRDTTISRLAQERPTLRFGCCVYLVPRLVQCGVNKANIDVYDTGKLYNYGSFKVAPVKLYHDVPNCGYRIYTANEKAVYMTDTGHLKGITARNYDLYLIESNYEEDDINRRIQAKTEAGEYCYELGVVNRHLSHTQASEFIMSNIGENGVYEFLHQHIDKERKNENRNNGG